jgi:D-glycero-D-manno-heptose 1,7-bisphosphate phosphatase
MKQPAIFLDRDGTMVEEVNFLHRPEEMRLFAFTGDALRKLKDAGFLIVVVTNQSGIGRGIYTEADMHTVHTAMQDQLGGAIDAFYFCPHLPDAGCECRKPKLGMINDARRDLDIETEASWIVGDKKIDVETGRNAGLRSGLVLTGYGRSHVELLDDKPDAIGDDLGAVVDLILGRRAL